VELANRDRVIGRRAEEILSEGELPADLDAADVAEAILAHLGRTVRARKGAERPGHVRATAP
jgi:hypothetical protein